jgi:hypothetical protein
VHSRKGHLQNGHLNLFNQSTENSPPKNWRFRHPTYNFKIAAKLDVTALLLNLAHMRKMMGYFINVLERGLLLTNCNFIHGEFKGLERNRVEIRSVLIGMQSNDRW